LEPSTAPSIIQAGFVGGLVGWVVIWIYEAVVWIGMQHPMLLSGIPSNATGLVFGLKFQHAIGDWAYFLGTGIHFTFAIAWGILFAAIGQSRQGYNTPKRTTRESLISQSPYRACLRPSLTYHRVESL
jgi:hypothetical protein